MSGKYLVEYIPNIGRKCLEVLNLKAFFRNVLYYTMRKYIDEKNLDIKHMKLREDEVSYFNLSSNPIILFSRGRETFFFRECGLILPKKQQLEHAIQSFFYSASRLAIDIPSFKQASPINLCFLPEEMAAFRRYLGNCISQREFLKRMHRADRISEEIGFSIWTKRDYNQEFFNSFGMYDLPEELRDIAIYFLWHMRSVAISFATMRIVRGDRYSLFNASKTISTRIVAEELGLSDMVTKADLCFLDIEGRTPILGVKCNSAPGERMKDVSVVPSKSLQQQLLALNVLDVICYQPDHGPNNYSVRIDNDGAAVICAFDNDNPYTFFPRLSVSHSFVGCAPLVGKDGRIARPYMDKDLANRILNWDIKALEIRLKPFLNSIQRKALRIRIKKLQCAIQRTIKSNRLFLATKEDCPDSYVTKELMGYYGETYFTRTQKKEQGD